MEKIKQWAAPLIVGVLLGMAGLSFGLNYVSPSTAQEQADAAAESATVAALAPICAQVAQTQPEVLASVLAKNFYQRRSAVSDAGWATYPEGASSTLKRAIDEGCVRRSTASLNSLQNTPLRTRRGDFI